MPWEAKCVQEWIFFWYCFADYYLNLGNSSNEITKSDTERMRWTHLYTTCKVLLQFGTSHIKDGKFNSCLHSRQCSIYIHCWTFGLWFLGGLLWRWRYKPQRKQNCFHCCDVWYTLDPQWLSVILCSKFLGQCAVHFFVTCTVKFFSTEEFALSSILFFSSWWPWLYFCIVRPGSVSAIQV